jgi:hypothetical protein
MFALLNILNFYTGKWMSKGLLILVAILIYCFVMRQMHDEIMGNRAYMITIIILMITDLVTIFTLFSDEKENEKVANGDGGKDGGSDKQGSPSLVEAINTFSGDKQAGIVKKAKSIRKTKRGGDKQGSPSLVEAINTSRGDKGERNEKKKDVVDNSPTKLDVKKDGDKQEIDVYDANEPSINTYK